MPGDSVEAYDICKDIISDSDVNDYAKSYAQAALDNNMTGEELRVQMNYVRGNCPQDYKDRINDWLGVDPTEGFRDGYCQVCGTRDDEKAYRGGTDSDGLVCIGCYEDFGEPDECFECGSVTYEGDSMASGEHEGRFFCNSCLLDL